MDGLVIAKHPDGTLLKSDEHGIYWDKENIPDPWDFNKVLKSADLVAGFIAPVNYKAEDARVAMREGMRVQDVSLAREKRREQNNDALERYISVMGNCLNEEDPCLSPANEEEKRYWATGWRFVSDARGKFRVVSGAQWVFSYELGLAHRVDALLERQGTLYAVQHILDRNLVPLETESFLGPFSSVSCDPTSKAGISLAIGNEMVRFEGYSSRRIGESMLLVNDGDKVTPVPVGEYSSTALAMMLYRHRSRYWVEQFDDKDLPF